MVESERAGKFYNGYHGHGHQGRNFFPKSGGTNFRFVWKFWELDRAPNKATGNSRFESQKFPPLSVKIPVIKIPLAHPVCKPKVITIVIYLQITN